MSILDVIARLPWRFARTMPDLPHEHTVRSPETETDYVALFNAIMTDGVVELWRGRRIRYLYPGDGRKYRFTWPVVINRALLPAPIDGQDHTAV